MPRFTVFVDMNFPVAISLGYVFLCVCTTAKGKIRKLYLIETCHLCSG